MDSVCQFDSLQCLPTQPLDGGSIGIQQRELHVFQGASSRQQVKRLKNKADFPVSHAGLLVYSQTRDILTIEEIASHAGLIKQSENVHHRGLAGSGGANYCNEVTSFDPESDVDQGMDHLSRRPRICLANVS